MFVWFVFFFINQQTVIKNVMKISVIYFALHF